ncbi:MAG: hypothetical protein Tsb0010_02300 [Parvularculaceae bacterium]
MFIVRFLVVALLAAIAVILGAVAYMGGFQKVEIARGSFGPAEIVFTTHRGPYREIGASWERFADEFAAEGFTRCNALAIYLDPPDAAPEDLRSILACRIDGLDEAEKRALAARFSHAVLPRTETFTASFPYRNYASYILAPMKVYPAFAKHDGGEAGDALLAIEVYGVEGEFDEIGFVLPIGAEPSDYQALYDAF